MIMMVVTAMAVAQLVVILVAVLTVKTAPMISPHMDPSAVILPGMSLVLTVLT